MAAGRGQRRVRPLRVGIGGRRLSWPLHSGDADRTFRLARRLPRTRRRLGDLPRHGGLAAHAGAKICPRDEFRRIAPPDGGASAQPAAARNLCGRLRRAVQLHRDIHLSELSSRRAAVQPLAGVPRLDLRRLSVRLGGGALSRARHRLARPAQLRAVRARRLGLRHAVQPDPVRHRDRVQPDRRLDLRHPHASLVDELRRHHREDRHLRRGRALCHLVLYRRHVRRLAAGASPTRPAAGPIHWRWCSACCRSWRRSWRRGGSNRVRHDDADDGKATGARPIRRSARGG